MDDVRDERRRKWARRKGFKTRDQKQGLIGGNPRYGKRRGNSQGSPRIGTRRSED